MMKRSAAQISNGEVIEDDDDVVILSSDSSLPKKICIEKEIKEIEKVEAKEIETNIVENNKFEEDDISLLDNNDGSSSVAIVPPKEIVSEAEEEEESTAVDEDDEISFIPQEEQMNGFQTSSSNNNNNIFDWKGIFYVQPTNQVKFAYMKAVEKKRRFKYEYNRFNKSIWKHLEINLQDDFTFTWKMQVRRELLNNIRNLYSNANLLVVGSTINGCGAYNCDMDLCISLPNFDGTFSSDRSFALNALRKIRKILEKNCPIIRKIDTIPAKVPILKMWFKAPYEHLEVDMNVNNMPGIYNSFLLHYYSRINDKFPTLALVVKNWAKIMNIGDASQGTFNSYSLILLVLHFLQVASDPPILPNLQQLYPEFFAYNKSVNDMKLFEELPYPLPETPKNSKTIGELLIGFFDYYSKFNFEKYGISIAKGSIFPRSDLCYTMNRYKIFIEEPYDLQNTARCVTQVEEYKTIKRAFKTACEQLTKKDKAPSLAMLGIIQE